MRASVTQLPASRKECMQTAPQNFTTELLLLPAGIQVQDGGHQMVRDGYVCQSSCTLITVFTHKVQSVHLP